MDSHLKYIIILACAVFISRGCGEILPEEIVNFSDDELFKYLCEAGVDGNLDGIITFEEAEMVTSLSVVGVGVEELKGIEAFINLDSLTLKMLPLKVLDLAGNSRLKYLNCSICDLKVVDLSENLQLTSVLCEKNQIESLLLPESTALETLRCGYNRLRELDVSGNPMLTTLSCNNNYLTSLNLSANIQLTHMISCGNQLLRLDVATNTRLTTLGIDNMPTLLEVRVWTLPFPPAGLTVLMGYSPNVEFVFEF